MTDVSEAGAVQVDVNVAAEAATVQIAAARAQLILEQAREAVVVILNNEDIVAKYLDRLGDLKTAKKHTAQYYEENIQYLLTRI